MLARDIMSRNLVTVGPSDTLSKVARALLDARVSAVPVVDAEMRPIGVISEWDLIGQHAPERVTRRDRWLAHLAEGQSLSAEYLEVVEPGRRTAADAMTRPAITAPESADLTEIAGILATRNVKRVFIVAEEKLVGVVSRADLARALMLQPTLSPARTPVAAATPAVASPPEPVAPQVAADEGTTAGAFRRLVEAHEAGKRAAARREHEVRDKARNAQVEKLAKERLSEVAWRGLLDNARAAAERGETDFLLIRFPSQLCDDGGRMINAPDPEWPTSLRGPAADVYERWRDELKPQGFGLTARILEFPDGFPGDAGISLTWGG